MHLIHLVVTSGGLRFKQRSSNTTRMSYLLKAVLQPDTYAKLAIAGNAFFPAYRREWSL